MGQGQPMGIGIWRRVAAGGVGSAVAICIAAIVLLALAAAAFAGASSTIVLLHALSFAGVAYGLAQVRAARAWADKVSGEVDAVSKRLLRLEAAMSEPDRATGSHVRSALADMTGEIALLGNVLRDLAGTVAAHDREMAALQSQGRSAYDIAPFAEPGVRGALPVPAAESAARGGLRPTFAASEPMPQFDADPVRATRRPVPERTDHGGGVDLPARTDASAAAIDMAARVPQPSSKAVTLRSSNEEARDGRGVAEIVQAFEADRIELHLQPVVALPQRRIRFYEVLARLRLLDDQVLVPAEFMGSVERVGLAAELDRRVISRAIILVRHLMSRGSEASVSCNLSPASVGDAAALRAILRLLEPHSDLMGRLILEISQRCWRTLDAERAGILASLRDRGVPFALDRANDMRLDPLSLAERGVRFVKLPAPMLLQPEAVAGLDIAVGDLAAVLGRAGIRLIGERVEGEEDVPDLIDLDVPMGQGFAFAPPRALRSDVVAGEGANPAPSSQTPAPAAPDQRSTRKRLPDPIPAQPVPESRQPYRAFLRRVG